MGIEEISDKKSSPQFSKTSAVEKPGHLEVTTANTTVTCRRSIIDEEGNVISENVETSTSTEENADLENNLKHFGFEMIPETKTVKKTFKTIIRKLDEEGNIVEETLDDGPLSDVTDLIERKEIFAEKDTSHDMTETSHTIITTTTKTVIKTVDEMGNISEQVSVKENENGKEIFIIDDEFKTPTLSEPSSFDMKIHIEELGDQKLNLSPDSDNASEE